VQPEISGPRPLDAGGGSAARSGEQANECVGYDAKGRHIGGGDEWCVLLWVEGGELLHDFESNGGEWEGLLACSIVDVAGLLKGVHLGRQDAVRGRW
jgi:hypothetical protein